MNEHTAAYYANKVHPKHYVLHAITSFLTLAAAIGSDVLILEYRHNQPHTVVWADGTVTSNFTFEIKSIRGTNSAMVGLMDDGRMVWKRN